MYYTTFSALIDSLDDEREFNKIVQQQEAHKTEYYRKNNICILMLSILINNREFNNLKTAYSTEQINRLFFKLLNLIDFKIINSLVEKHVKINFLNELFSSEFNQNFNDINKNIINKEILNNTSFFYDNEEFILCDKYGNHENSQFIANVLRLNNDLLVKHYIPYFFYSPENFAAFFAYTSIEQFKKFTPAIYNDTLYIDKEGIKTNHYFEKAIIANLGSNRVAYKTHDLYLCEEFFNLTLYVTKIFYFLLDQYSSKEKDPELLSKIIFLQHEKMIDLTSIFENWKEEAKNLNLSSNTSQSIEKYKSHPFLKLIKKGFHQTALYILEQGYKLSEEENSYIKNSSVKTSQLYSEYTFEIKDSLIDEFKFHIDKSETNKSSYKKIEESLKDENIKLLIFDKFIAEDKNSFKKLLPELINISKTEINKYNFLSTVDMLIINMNTTAIELLFEYNYPFNIKQMLLFCRFSRKHYDKYRRVITYLSDFLVERPEHYNYFLSHNLNITKEDGIQINEKYVRQLTGNYSIPLNKGMGLSAINRLSQHLRFNDDRFIYHKGPLNLNMCAYFLEQDFQEINEYYDIGSICYIVLLKADEGFDVSSLFNVLLSNNADEAIEFVINLINQDNKENLTTPFKHFLMLNDKRKLNKIVEENQQEKKRKRI